MKLDNVTKEQLSKALSSLDLSADTQLKLCDRGISKVIDLYFAAAVHTAKETPIPKETEEWSKLQSAVGKELDEKLFMVQLPALGFATEVVLEVLKQGGLQSQQFLRDLLRY